MRELHHKYPVDLGHQLVEDEEHLALKAATAYQSASKRRVPPPMFKPLPGEP